MWASTLLLMGLNAAPAHAAATDWAGTRWLMQVEEVLPVPIDLTAMSNLGFLTKALQLQVVAQCDEAVQRNKKVFVLTCRIDDARMRATPHGESPTERELENSAAALKEFAARMITTEVEVQFHSSGKVMRVDVLGLEATEPREKQSAELLRQLATDLVMGWTVKLPKEWGGAWAETNSPIFRVPAHPAWNTSNQIRHAASDVDGKRVVESIGRGIFTTAYDPWELEANARLGQAITADQSAEGAGGTRGEDGVGATVYGGRLVGGGPVMASSTPEAREYEGNFRSVAVIDPESGRINERVWSLEGGATARSIGSFQGVNVVYSGRLQLLSATDQPTLVTTELIAPPNVLIEGLNPWSPLDSQGS